MILLKILEGGSIRNKLISVILQLTLISEVAEVEDTISDLEVSLERLEVSLELAASQRRRKERVGRALTAKIQELQQSKLLIEEKIREAKYFLEAVRIK